MVPILVQGTTRLHALFPAIADGIFVIGKGGVVLELILPTVGLALPSCCAEEAVFALATASNTGRLVRVVDWS